MALGDLAMLGSQENLLEGMKDLKQKEQRASKSNARLLDLNCSKCGQLFSSAIGLKNILAQPEIIFVNE
jgi:hypothetical protein